MQKLYLNRKSKIGWVAKMMFGKIKSFISKIKLRRKRNKCYDIMESAGIATMGMCESITICDISICLNCPYYKANIVDRKRG